MRKTLTTAALLLALSCYALAGEMHTGSTPPPEPTPTPAVVVQTPEDDATVDGNIHTGVTESAAGTLLDLLSVLPSLLL